MGTPVVLENVTVCFPHLFKPHAAPGSDKEKYSVECLLDPNNPQHQAVIRQIDAAYTTALTEAGKANMVGIFPKPYKTGAEVNQSRATKGKAPREEVTGKVLVRASDDNGKPAVVNQQMQPILDPLAIFAGCVCNVHIDVYFYGQSANPGVFCGLNGVQLVDNVNVKRIGGGAPSAEQMFKPVAGPPQNPTAATPPVDAPPWM